MKHEPIMPGEFFEDCACHPCLCTAVDEFNISGYSLVNGRSVFCSWSACGIRKLTLEQAIVWREHGPDGTRDLIPAIDRWWKAN